MMSTLFQYPAGDVVRPRPGTPLRREARLRLYAEDCGFDARLFGAPLASHLHFDAHLPAKDSQNVPDGGL